MQFTAGICAAKALVQHLCERFDDPASMHVFIPVVQDTMQTQILRSRGFVAYVPAVLLSNSIF
jgi:hypothetical protein